MVRHLKSHPHLTYPLLSIVLVGIFIVFSLPTLATIVNAESTVCPATVEAAVAVTGELCDGTPGNNACYGHILVDADVRNMPAETFNEPGEYVELEMIDSLRLSAMNIDDGTWGVAQMHLKAPATASTLSSVNILLFGDVTINNSIPTQTRVEVTTINQGVNLRSLPSAEAYVGRSVLPNTSLLATGRTEDSVWVRVEAPGSDYIGWVTNDLIAPDPSINELPVITSNDIYYGPMHAFQFSSESDRINCGEMPVDGLILQTPEGPAQVKVYINEVSIDLLPSTGGNTLFVQAEPQGDMTVSVLSGSAYVESDDSGQVAVAGSQVTIPLSADLSPTGPVSVPVAYSQNSFSDMVSYFPNGNMNIAPPATQEEIEASNVFAESLQEQASESSESDADTPETGDDASDSPAAPVIDSRDDDDDSEDTSPPPARETTDDARDKDEPDDTSTDTEDNDNDTPDGDDDDDTPRDDDEDDVGADEGIGNPNNDEVLPIDIEVPTDTIRPTTPSVETPTDTIKRDGVVPETADTD